MKRITVLFLATTLCLCLAACSKESEIEQSLEKIQTEAIEELVGMWHLDGDRNDPIVLSERFPGYAEWGAAMEIQSDGHMRCYIGAESWNGTYTVEDGVIHTQLTFELDQSTQLWNFRIAAETVEMDCEDMTLFWVYGEQKDPANGFDNE